MQTFLNRSLFIELSGLLCLTRNRTLKCDGSAVNEHRDEQNGERFKAKLRKKKYCQYMLNRKYQTETSSSDKKKKKGKLLISKLKKTVAEIKLPNVM